MAGLRFSSGQLSDLEQRSLAFKQMSRIPTYRQPHRLSTEARHAPDISVVGDARDGCINNIFELGPRPTSAVAAAAASGALGDVQTSPPVPHENPPISMQVEPTKPKS